MATSPPAPPPCESPAASAAVPTWQEILAVDSRASRLRGANAMAQDLRPLYIKRRMQLLQGRRGDLVDRGRCPGSAGADEEEPGGGCDLDVVDDPGNGGGEKDLLAEHCIG